MNEDDDSALSHLSPFERQIVLNNRKAIDKLVNSSATETADIKQRIAEQTGVDVAEVSHHQVHTQWLRDKGVPTQKRGPKFKSGSADAKLGHRWEYRKPGQATIVIYGHTSDEVIQRLRKHKIPAEEQYLHLMTPKPRANT
jgi:hypothetical protein